MKRPLLSPETWSSARVTVHHANSKLKPKAASLWTTNPSSLSLRFNLQRHCVYLRFFHRFSTSSLRSSRWVHLKFSTCLIIIINRVLLRYVCFIALFPFRFHNLFLAVRYVICVVSARRIIEKRWRCEIIFHTKFRQHPRSWHETFTQLEIY